MSAVLEAADLVTQTRKRVLEAFRVWAGPDVWAGADPDVIADFETMVDDLVAAVDLAARARSLTEFVDEMNVKLNRVSQETKS